MRPHIAAIYAFARTADDFADEPGYTPDERLGRLDHWRALLYTAARGEPSTIPSFARSRTPSASAMCASIC